LELSVGVLKDFFFSTSVPKAAGGRVRVRDRGGGGRVRVRVKKEGGRE
jgi:hypothetical protein